MRDPRHRRRRLHRLAHRRQLVDDGHEVRVLDAAAAAGPRRGARLPQSRRRVRARATWATAAPSRRRWPGSTRSAIRRRWSASASTSTTRPDYVRHNDLGTAVLLRRAGRRGASRGRLVLASSMVVYGEGALPLPRARRRWRPDRGALQDLEAGRFEPRCPVCGGAAEPRRRSTEDAPTRSAQRLRRHQAPPGAPVRRVRPRVGRDGDRAALPQRLRTADAARHAVRRRRVDLRQRAGRAVRRPRCSRTAASCATSSTSATWPGPTSSR